MIVAVQKCVIVAALLLARGTLGAVWDDVVDEVATHGSHANQAAEPHEFWSAFWQLVDALRSDVADSVHHATFGWVGRPPAAGGGHTRRNALPRRGKARARSPSPPPQQRLGGGATPPHADPASSSRHTPPHRRPLRRTQYINDPQRHLPVFLHFRETAMSAARAHHVFEVTQVCLLALFVLALSKAIMDKGADFFLILFPDVNTPDVAAALHQVRRRAALCSAPVVVCCACVYARRASWAAQAKVFCVPA